MDAFKPKMADLLFIFRYGFPETYFVDLGVIEMSSKFGGHQQNEVAFVCFRLSRPPFHWIWPKITASNQNGHHGFLRLVFMWIFFWLTCLPNLTIGETHARSNFFFQTFLGTFQYFNNRMCDSLRALIKNISLVEVTSPCLWLQNLLSVHCLGNYSRGCLPRCQFTPNAAKLFV